MKHKERLDVLLVARNLAESRSKAQAMIMAGEVYVNEQKADKAGLEVNIDEDPVIEVRGSACPYVSRGGLKLEKALRDFGVDPTGFVCSDSGASTGGFTDCLLQHGASNVGKKGVVRDPAVHADVLQNFFALADSLHFTVRNLTFSPVKGPEGNIEFLAHLSMQPGQAQIPDVAALVAQAHETLKG